MSDEQNEIRLPESEPLPGKAPAPPPPRPPPEEELGGCLRAVLIIVVGIFVVAGLIFASCFLPGRR
jgi:hypothetical protein